MSVFDRERVPYKRLGGSTIALAVFVVLLRAGSVHAQACEAAMDKATGKYVKCRLYAESKFVKTGDGGRRAAALSKCQVVLQAAFTKATASGPCPATATEPQFESYLTQCSDDTAAAAGGAALPDYLGTIASCNANLASAQADLSTCQGNLATCEATPKGQPKTTGQSQCWDGVGTAIPCAGTGQDAQFAKGLPVAFVDNSDGTITDPVTGLTWEKLSQDGSVHEWSAGYDWTAAFSKIDSLNVAAFAGHTDWRLPNMFELITLVDMEYTTAYPTIKGNFDGGCLPGCTVLTCSCTKRDYYWTSTSHILDPSEANVVGFADGHLTSRGKSSGAYVRAVRGGS